MKVYLSIGKRFWRQRQKSHLGRKQRQEKAELKINSLHILPFHLLVFCWTVTQGAVHLDDPRQLNQTSRLLVGAVPAKLSTLKVASTGINYIIPTNLLDLLNSAAILTAFYGKVNEGFKSRVVKQTSQLAQLPPNYELDLSSKPVSIGATSGSTLRDLLVSSFIPFSWDQMKLEFDSIATLGSKVTPGPGQIGKGKLCSKQVNGKLQYTPCSQNSIMRDYYCEPACISTDAYKLYDKLICGCYSTLTETVVASAQLVIAGPGLDPSTCGPKSPCAAELQQVIFDAVNTVVSKQIVQMCLGLKLRYGGDDRLQKCKSSMKGFWPIPSSSHSRQLASSANKSEDSWQAPVLGSDSASLRKLGVSNDQRANQIAWAQDLQNKNTNNKKVKKKRALTATSGLGSLQTGFADGVSISFATQLNTHLVSMMSGGVIAPSSDAVITLTSRAFADLRNQTTKSADKLIKQGYLDRNLNIVKATSSFAKALAAGSAQAGGISSSEYTVIKADMSDVVHDASANCPQISNAEA